MRFFQDNKKIYAYFICFVAALFFLYEFIQINMFNSIDSFVAKSYGLDAAGLGFISSIYFYSTVAFLLPAGQLLDFFSAKKTILVTLLVCVIGLFGFAVTHNFYAACFFRLLEGVGSAFCFLGSFRIASNWVPKSELPFITGIIVTIGMLGGVIAQTPLSLLVSSFGWRNALQIDSLLGVIIFLIIMTFLHDSPNKRISPAPENFQKTKIHYWKTLSLVYKNKHNWFCGLYTCLMNLPMVLLGALWGTLYLKNVNSLTAKNASEIISFLFIGCIIGSPFYGFLSKKIKNPKKLMIFGAISTLIIFITFMNYSGNNLTLLIGFFVALGFFSSSQIFGYPAAAMKAMPENFAMSASVVSFTTMSGYIVFQPLFGYLLDYFSKSDTIRNLSYSESAFHSAILIIPIACFVSLLVSVFLKISPN